MDAIAKINAAPEVSHKIFIKIMPILQVVPLQILKVPLIT